MEGKLVKVALLYSVASYFEEVESLHYLHMRYPQKSGQNVHASRRCRMLFIVSASYY